MIEKIISAIVCYYVAKKFNREVWIGAIIGLFFGYGGIIGHLIFQLALEADKRRNR